MLPSLRLSLVAGVWFSFLSSAFGQGTFFLKEQSLETASNDALAEQQSRWLVRVEKPEDLKGMPDGIGKRVYFYSGNVGEREVLALVESGSPRKLYIDMNGNRDFSDEQPVTAKRVRSGLNWGWSQSYRFGPLSLPVLPDKSKSAEAAADKGNEDASPKAANTSDNKQSSKAGTFYAEQFDLDYLLIRAAVCRRGTVRLKDKSYSVVLADGNYNARYDDTFRFALNRTKSRGGQNDPAAISADYLGIDLNRNGRFDNEEYAGSEIQALTKLIQFQGTYYSVQVAPDGSSITLDEGRPDLGKLDIGKQQADLMVMSENGMFRLTAKDEPVDLPTGRYRLVYVVLRGVDSKKVRYSLQGRAPETKATEFTIDKGVTTGLKFGPPLKLKSSQRAARTLLSGRVVSFGVSCTDELGIEYRVGADRSGRMGPAPSVRILDENNKILSVGQFEYG